ncbi:hypothetical protein GTQ43_33445 [Nostoc sp. KVJ3]|uniref:hypothetical protein n=1 Tax=Nostoc sp. KVJ3 TaxID=457945 RepID=UPI0022371F84|nr:hypothetical protein [Nostoc sp. KVJ3]MCW5318447.1 hypothetical protein [Nostoc sp. KVJ3]
MGGHPYWYYTKYRTDVDTTLQLLRQQEFTAGRYNPVLPFIDFPITADSPIPGSQHSSIEEAMEAADADGTRSILDMFQVSTISYSEALASSKQGGMELFCTTFPLSTDELIRLFSTEKPTHEMVETVIVASEQNEEAASEFWESIDRGTGRHIVIYEDDEPVEVFFIGYSFD